MQHFFICHVFEGFRDFVSVALSPEVVTLTSLVVKRSCGNEDIFLTFKMFAKKAFSFSHEHLFNR